MLIQERIQDFGKLGWGMGYCLVLKRGVFAHSRDVSPPPHYKAWGSPPPPKKKVHGLPVEVVLNNETIQYEVNLSAIYKCGREAVVQYILLYCKSRNFCVAKIIAHQVVSDNFM